MIQMSANGVNFWSLYDAPAMLDGAGHQYTHCKPLEAVSLSQTGKAYGFDLSRYGMHSYESPVLHAATAYKTGIQFLFGSDLENKFIWEDPELGTRGATTRSSYVSAKNFFLWDSLPRFNRDFIDSLLWVPEIPMTPLAVLATALNDY